MSATIKRVAERVGVSVSTASHILCGRSERYRPETRENVLRAAAELQYRPNASAQAVKSGRFETVALVLSDDPERSALFGELASGVSAGLKERNYHLSLTMLSDQELTNEEFIPSFLRVWHADGLLIAYFSKIPERFVQLIEKYYIPSVWINSMQKANCVYADELRAGREATKYLLDPGHRRIAYADYTAPDEPLMLRRYEGYQTCMQDAGLPARELGEETHLPRSERIEYSRQWLASADAPTAVVAFGVTTALPIYEAAVSLGVSVPFELLEGQTCGPPPASRDGSQRT